MHFVSLLTAILEEEDDEDNNKTEKFNNNIYNSLFDIGTFWSDTLY